MKEVLKRHSLPLAICFALLLPMLVAWFAFPTPDGTSSWTDPSAATAAGSAPAGRQSPSSAASKVELRGTVVDDSKTSLSGVRVTLFQQGKRAGTATTKADGSFMLRVDPNHEVRLELTKTGFANLAHVVETPTEEVELTMTSGAGASGELSGVVLDAEGAPVRGATVSCPTGNRELAMTNAEGRFKLPASAEGCNATASNGDLASAPTKLSLGDGNELVLQGPGQISGIVRQEDGSPLAHYRIGVESFVGVDGTRSSRFGKNTDVDDGNGAFTLEGLTAGSYVLVVTAPDKPPTKSRTIELSAGEHVRGVTIQLAKGQSVTGVVTSRETGAPIVGASIRLDAISSSGASFAPVSSDEAGRFSLEGAPTESFSIRVTHPEYKDRIVTVDRSAGTDLKIDLGAKGDGTDTEMTGIGATLMQGSRTVEVATVLAGGPAEGAGLKSGDRIEQIDGRDASTLSVSEAVQKLRGAEGTRVNVRVGRGKQQLDLTITRAKISR